MRKPYVQFSKRVVVSVCVAVTALATVGVVLSYTAGEMNEATEIIKVYIQYAMVVFAAYSGNSAVEKWLVRRWGSTHPEAEQAE